MSTSTTVTPLMLVQTFVGFPNVTIMDSDMLVSSKQCKSKLFHHAPRMRSNMTQGSMHTTHGTRTVDTGVIFHPSTQTMSTRHVHGWCLQALMNVAHAHGPFQHRLWTQLLCTTHPCIQPGLVFDRLIRIFLKFSAALAADDVTSFYKTVIEATSSSNLFSSLLIHPSIIVTYVVCNATCHLPSLSV